MYIIKRTLFVVITTTTKTVATITKDYIVKPINQRMSDGLRVLNIATAFPCWHSHGNPTKTGEVETFLLQPLGEVNPILCGPWND